MRDMDWAISEELVTLGALKPRQVDELARVGQNDEYGGEQTGHPEEQVAELQRQVLCAHDKDDCRRRLL